jgi:hypothetical protein
MGAGGSGAGAICDGPFTLRRAFRTVIKAPLTVASRLTLTQQHPLFFSVSKPSTHRVVTSIESLTQASSRGRGHRNRGGRGTKGGRARGG